MLIAKKGFLLHVFGSAPLQTKTTGDTKQAVISSAVFLLAYFYLNTYN